MKQHSRMEVLKVIELKTKILTKSINSRISDGALEFAEHPIHSFFYKNQ